MRKFLLAAILSVLFISCKENRNIQQVENSAETINLKGVGYIQIIKYEYDGHSYIMHKHSIPFKDQTYAGVVHDPDCKCFSKN